MTQLTTAASLAGDGKPEALLGIARNVAAGEANGQTDGIVAKLVPELLTVISQNVGTSSERLAVGEVLASLGDPRICSPKDDDYWVEVPYEVARLKVAKFPVTNREFRAWVDAGGYDDQAAWTEDGWAWLQATENPWPVSAAQDGVEPFVVDNQPVVGVTYFEAVAYAKAHDARLLRLDERKWITRGKERRPYPWGSPFGEGNANTQEEVLGRPCAVGLYVRDRTPEGVCDLAGNVAEWTADDSGERRVVHPGAWDQPSMAAWAKAISLKAPEERYPSLGFRLSRDVG